MKNHESSLPDENIKSKDGGFLFFFILFKKESFKKKRSKKNYDLL